MVTLNSIHILPDSIRQSNINKTRGFKRTTHTGKSFKSAQMIDELFEFRSSDEASSAREPVTSTNLRVYKANISREISCNLFHRAMQSHQTAQET
ncbi:MAG: hypothetical protein AB8B70_11940, partial [Prochlorococcus sp.]